MGSRCNKAPLRPKNGCKALVRRKHVPEAAAATAAAAARLLGPPAAAAAAAAAAADPPRFAAAAAAAAAAASLLPLLLNPLLLLPLLLKPLLLKPSFEKPLLKRPLLPKLLESSSLRPPVVPAYQNTGMSVSKQLAANMVCHKKQAKKAWQHSGLFCAINSKICL